MSAMGDYETYLAANVLNDGKTISYRLLARELKVHANNAKCMLFDFHKRQNEKKLHSVHACYVLDGFLKSSESAVPGPNQVDDTNDEANNQDSVPQSSPFMSSAPTMDVDGSHDTSSSTRQIVIVKEEHVQELSGRFEKIISVFIHSLSPTSLQNLEQLSDCNRIITKQFIGEDPLEFGRKYGVIQNPHVKRRIGKQPPIPPPVPAAEIPKQSKASKIKDSTPPASTNGPTTTSQTSQAKKAAEPVSDPKSQAATKAPSTGKATSKTAGIKRESSDLFKSFSKTKPKLKKQDSASTMTSQDAPNPAADDDEPMKDASEDEQPEDFAFKANTTRPSSKSRSQREEELRKMMEEDDDEDEEDDIDMKDPSDEPPKPEPKAEPPKAASPEPQTKVTVSGGRRRGRRRVMKKKTVKDAEGYLVTKEEPAWESFSEDEPPPQASKEKTPFPGPASSAKAKNASGGGKPGQGNIMNFFGKK